MASDAQPSTPPAWTLPTRQCRLCREDVSPTVTTKYSSLGSSFQQTHIEYVSEEDGRLIKPCKCKGSLRFIHEQCLANLRSQAARQDLYLKCDLCGFKYNTRRLLLYDILLSRVVRIVVTILILIFVMFVLGFVADPIINLYIDPYDTMASRRFWRPVVLDDLGDDSDDSWVAQHFLKGFVSIGVMGFVKAVLLANPWQFWNLRHSGLLGGTARARNTGRDRAVNISWIAVLIGIGSALYLFYQWVSKFAHSTLTKFANNVIETHMDDDDEDLQPPPGWAAGPSPNSNSSDARSERNTINTEQRRETARENPTSTPFASVSDPQVHCKMPGSFDGENEAHPRNAGHSSALDEAQGQGWSFGKLKS